MVLKKVPVTNSISDLTSKVTDVRTAGPIKLSVWYQTWRDKEIQHKEQICIEGFYK